MVTEITNNIRDKTDCLESAVTGLSIVLYTSVPAPGFALNPEFLIYNKIIEEDMILDAQPAQPMFNLKVMLKNSVTIESDMHRIFVTQHFDEQSKSKYLNFISPSLAKRILEKAPYISFNAIGVNPTRFCRSSEYRVSDVLSNRGEWMRFNDVLPRVEMKSIYHYESRTVIVQISSEKQELSDGSTAIQGVRFSANFRREINPRLYTGDRQVELQSALSCWRSDLDDFNRLFSNFDDTLRI